jgi:hypothetical protein
MKDVLDAVADECFHVFQDATHGFGWRGSNLDTPEREAQDFTDSKHQTIVIALRAYGARY